MASTLPGLRRAAPRLSKAFFICHQCLKQPPPALRQLRLPATSNISRTIRFNSSTATIPEPLQPTKSPLTSLSETISHVEKQQQARRAFFPETSSNTVAYWLLGSAASVFGLVVFGGLTRLTESGLSITEWRPVAGSLPPLSLQDWQSEFDKYRASPEFKLLNPHMTLEEFKKIYYMEWGHRLWGRVVGLSFVLPAIYFVARRKVSANMSWRLIGIAGLIGAQGAMGWYMVQSGLKDDLFAPGSHPRVSQYRLTAHLGVAFICYIAMLWNGLSILRINTLLSHPNRAIAQLSHLKLPILSPFRKSVFALTLLVFTTAMSGGLVAGLDAGMIYNEFPRMGTGLHPPKSELFDKFYCRKEDGSDLFWRNMLENPSTVQLNHRVLATTTFTAVLGLWVYSRFNRRVRGALPNGARKGMLGVVHLVLLQATLGISTLIYLCPIPLASAHQAGSLALLTSVLVLGNRVWVPRRAWRLVEQSVKQSGASALPKIKPGIVHQTSPAVIPEHPLAIKRTAIEAELRELGRSKSSLLGKLGIKRIADKKAKLKIELRDLRMQEAAIPKTSFQPIKQARAFTTTSIQKRGMATQATPPSVLLLKAAPQPSQSSESPEKKSVAASEATSREDYIELLQHQHMVLRNSEAALD